MNCPKCGKELEIKNKQVGVDENNQPILNEYAICRDCKKQWNLDKQKEKKAAAPAAKAASKPPSPKAAEPRKEAEPKKTDSKRPAQATDTASSKRPVKSEGSAPKRKSAPSGDRPAPKKRPVSDADGKQAPGETTQTYSNIPPEKIRAKKERTVRQNYEDMLATDPNRKQPVQKKRPASSSEPVRKKAVPSDTSNRQPSHTARKKPAAQPRRELPIEEEVMPKFQILRIIFGVVSLTLFAFFAYKGFMAGLSNISSGKSTMAGTVYIVMALCMLVSGLLLFILRNKDTILTFVFPMFFYLGSAVFAFIKRSDDKFLIIGAGIEAVLGIIFLVLTFASRGAHDEEDFEDDYDDPFEDEHDN